ncbi:ubiquitin-related domain-containing protein [Bisporella sp. PMI_857]|nr:ubiquitin-related domain-containing protein [Bisporella sp. PMI_857]
MATQSSTVATEGGGPTNSSSASPQHTVSVEMDNLDTTRTGTAQGLLNDVSIPITSPIASDFAAPNTGSPEMENKDTEPKDDKVVVARDFATSASSPDAVAIGADGTPPTPIAPSQGPVLVITLLLTSGARHPYKIDEKYLTKRNVTVPGVTEDGKKDPFSISVYTLKELILREWREEWEAKPVNPSYIRLIYFGRLLDEKTHLKDLKFSTTEANVVHMTVKPQDLVDEEEASKNKTSSRDRNGEESTAGCRCVIL